MRKSNAQTILVTNVLLTTPFVENEDSAFASENATKTIWLFGFAVEDLSVRFGRSAKVLVKS